MEDFYKDFKDRIEGRPDPEFRPEDWSDMEARLDGQSTGVIPIPLMWWAVPFVILGLTGWGLYLNNTLMSYSGSDKDAVQVTDTVFIEKVVYKTDTVFQEKIEYVTLPPEVIERIVYLRDQSEVTGPTSFALGQDQQRTFEGSTLQSGLAKLEGQRERSWLTSSEDHIVSGSEGGLFASADQFSILDPIPSLVPTYMRSRTGQSSDRRRMATPYLDMVKLSRSGTAPDLFRPRALSIEIGSGLTSALNTPIDHLFGYTLVAGAKLRFDPGYRLWADVSLQNMRFQSNQMGDDLGIPVVIPPSGDFDFENAKVPRRSLQYSLGLDYLINTGRPVRPVLGIGIAGVEYFPVEIVYDFVNRDNGAEFIFERNSDDLGLRVNYALFKLGVEFALSPRYDLGINGFYRKGLDDGFGINDLIEARLSLSARIF